MLFNDNKGNRLTRIINRLSLYPEDQWNDLIERLPDEPAFPGRSDQTLKQKIRYEMQLYKEVVLCCKKSHPQESNQKNQNG